MKLKLKTEIDRPYTLMFSVLKDNKHQFANLFMDHGLNIGKNWTRTTMDKLFKETVNTNEMFDEFFN